MNKGRVAMAVGVSVVSLLAGWTARGRFGRTDSAAPAAASAMPRMAPPLVTVQTVRLAPLPAVTEIVARIEPVQTAHIRAEVSGAIAEVHFEEGARVEQGALLFTIEPDQYRATVAAREAELDRANAELERARLYARRLKDADARSISRTALETAESDLLRAEAGVKLARANLDLARIALNRTEIRAPIGGRIGAAQATRGNVAGPASGPLAHIVQTDPVRIRFSLADRDFLGQRRHAHADDSGAPLARVRLPDGAVLPTVGRLDFIDNLMNPDTGSIAVRYRFENPDEQLVPGGHATILLEKPDREDGIAVPQKAVLADAQGAYVLTVAPNNVVAVARIATGAQIGPDVVVRFGLKPRDRVIVDGVQKAYPGFPVQATSLEDSE